MTAAVTDEAGRTFEDNKAVKVYPIPSMVFNLPAAVHTDDMVTLDTALTDMEGLTAVWYVDNTYGFSGLGSLHRRPTQQSGRLHCFKRAGVYDLQARGGRRHRTGYSRPTAENAKFYRCFPSPLNFLLRAYRYADRGQNEGKQQYAAGGMVTDEKRYGHSFGAGCQRLSQYTGR